MKLRNTKRVKSDEASKFVKKEEPSEIGTFVKRKKAVTKTIEKTVTVSAKSSKAKKTNLRLDDDEDSIVDNKSNVDSEVILKALDVLQELNRIFSEKRNELFDDNKTIILQIECVKIPDCVSRKLRFDLPHWLITDTSDICLFVTDLKKGRRVDHEPTIQHYEDLLREKGITMIKSIIPMRQVRVEYDQLEMKRRLLTQHDFFLADAKISGLLAHKLGSTFYRKKQLPTPLKMDSKDLKAAVERALHKSVMKLHGTGQSYTLAVANGKHTAQEACENIHAVLLQLVNKFPGGWNNVRSLHLKHPLSMAIPIYMTLKNKNTVENVVIKPLRPENDVVEGELSTILGAKVKVHPRGEVEIDVDKSEISEDECSEEDVEIPKKKMKMALSKNNRNSSKDDCSEEDDENGEDVDSDENEDEEADESKDADEKEDSDENEDEDGDDDEDEDDDDDDDISDNE